jgi:SAM-dependent methyltransferase
VHEWDHYAPFYDWENARTMGRRDIAFWTSFAKARSGRSLELGCGTGRVTLPLARAGARVTGVDFSAAMLARAVARARRVPSRRRPPFVRGDIRALPFAEGSFARVLAPYGVLQSLTTDADLRAAIRQAARVLARGGWFGIDLVPDLPAWESYQKQVRFRGRLRGADLTLVESVRQDRRRGLTIFDEVFTTGRGRSARTHTFSLTFRTVSIRALGATLERADLVVDGVYGDYRGGPWRWDSGTWLVTAKKA